MAQGAVQVERLQREAQRAEEALAAAKARRTEAFGGGGGVMVDRMGMVRGVLGGGRD